MTKAETADIGVERVGRDIPDVDEEAADDWVLIRTSEPVEVQLGRSAGNPVTVEAEYFAVISVDTEIRGRDAIMAGEQAPDPADVDEIEGDTYDEVDEEDIATLLDSAVIDVNEASVITSNADGEIGHGILTVEGGGIDDAIDDFLSRIFDLDEDESLDANPKENDGTPNPEDE